jgi:hypothetical protein
MKIPVEDRLLLRPSILGILGLLVVCSLFVAGGVWMASKGQWMGWVGIVFFGLGVIVALVQLLPNASYLRLTENGLEVRSLYRSWFVSWDEIAYFAIANIGYGDVVVFMFSDRYHKAKTSRALARAIAGYEGALPDTYGMKADELCCLLSEWKRRFEQE